MVAKPYSLVEGNHIKRACLHRKESILSGFPIHWRDSMLVPKLYASHHLFYKVRTKTIKSRFESIITIGGTMITYDDSEYYVGLSLSNCVTSIFKGEMRKRQVIGMMTNTRCDTLKDYLDVLDNYLTVSYWSGLFDTRNDLNRLINIAYYLYSEIPFHQPRVEQGYVLVSNAPDNPKLNLQEPIFWRDVTWMIAYKDKFSSYWHKKKPINRHDELLNMETIEKFKDDVYEKLLESGHEFRDKVSS